jgi:hypothetical protein
MVTPIRTLGCNEEALASEAERIRSVLAASGVRVAVDPNWRLPALVRFKASEQRGVPLRIEVSLGVCSGWHQAGLGCALGRGW